MRSRWLPSFSPTMHVYISSSLLGKCSWGLGRKTPKPPQSAFPQLIWECLSSTEPRRYPYYRMETPERLPSNYGKIWVSTTTWSRILYLNTSRIFCLPSRPKSYTGIYHHPTNDMKFPSLPRFRFKPIRTWHEKSLSRHLGRPLLTCGRMPSIPATGLFLCARGSGH